MKTFRSPHPSLTLWQRFRNAKTTVPDFRLAEPVPRVHQIELNLRDINQLFNTMDPSPFHEKDLDRDAEEFIVSWAREFPKRDPLELVLHLAKLPEEHDGKRLVQQAVHNYFAYRARLNQLEFRQLMKQGRTSLLVGLSFLGICLLTIQFLPVTQPGPIHDFLTQSFTIAGWVAMWRPMEIYLYGWWPLRRRGAIFEKLSRMSVQVLKQA